MRRSSPDALLRRSGPEQAAVGYRLAGWTGPTPVGLRMHGLLALDPSGHAAGYTDVATWTAQDNTLIAIKGALGEVEVDRIQEWQADVT